MDQYLAREVERSSAGPTTLYDRDLADREQSVLPEKALLAEEYGKAILGSEVELRSVKSLRALGLIDQTSCLKKGDKSPGTLRQSFGAVAKQDNGRVRVHLWCAVEEIHDLLSREL